MPSDPTDAQGAGMLSHPQPRQPKNWRLVLQQIIDCRDERDKVLMIAQDALNMSQPEPQDTELRALELFRSFVYSEMAKLIEARDDFEPQSLVMDALHERISAQPLGEFVQQEIARAQPNRATTRRELELLCVP